MPKIMYNTYLCYKSFNGNVSLVRESPTLIGPATVPGWKCRCRSNIRRPQLQRQTPKGFVSPTISAIFVRCLCGFPIHRHFLPCRSSLRRVAVLRGQTLSCYEQVAIPSRGYHLHLAPIQYPSTDQHLLHFRPRNRGSTKN